MRDARKFTGKILPIFLAGALALSLFAAAGCGSAEESTAESETSAAAEEGTDAEGTGTDDGSGETADDGSYAARTAVTVDAVHAVDAETLRQDNSGEFNVTAEASDDEENDEEDAEETGETGEYSLSDDLLLITSAGEYVLSGTFSGRIEVDAPDDAEVCIVLNGVSVTCDAAAPLFVKSADKLVIESSEDTFNEITDARAISEQTEDESEEASGETSDDTEAEDADSADAEEVTAEDAGAAVWACCDISFKGKGALEITGGHNAGILSKDEIAVKKTILKVTAAGCGVKGKDGVSVESGSVMILAEGGDGIKTVNSGETAGGNEKGNVEISGGLVDIYAAGDGISAARDVKLSGDGSLNISTDSYADFSGTGEDGTEFYIVISTSDYNENCDYYAYYFNSDDSQNGVFLQAVPSITVSGGRSYYYGLLIAAPSGYDSVTFFTVATDEDPSSVLETVSAEGESTTDDKNGFLVSTSSDGVLEGDYVSLTLNAGSAQEYSTKGIKAASSIVVKDEITVTIKATDDALHANADETLENGDAAEGTISIKGGTLEITSGDDGMHADTELSVSGGTTNILSSYEGLEAPKVTVDGGETFVYATDDAVNAGGVSSDGTICVTVNGGYLDVKTPSGDTDAIDSNGDYVQNGGFVIVRGGSSSGSVAGSVDVDGSITVNGGAIVALGGVCESPSGTANAYVLSGTSMAAGNYVLSDGDGNEIVTFSLSEDYSGFWVACDLLLEDTDYTLSADGTEVSSWTQESGTMGATSGMGGMGGMGGGRH